ncbi:neural cell adhesion molecule 1-B-like isoform X2 [Mytilus californianus]|uniref:neural cell adhesion molecule 1-B-like isoform X2 n=1 Tax=Mytilus californianus TaxID=6549 RepID=UPI0022454CAB|nr:neural cell adhesion molecule 1-B-like isoform X2 [Mytilus californianus]
MRILQLLSLFLTFSELLAVNVLYHFENETVILPCDQLSNKTIVWTGPDNYTTYGYGDIIDPNLSKSKRLSIIHVNGSLQYNLQIRHFSSEDEGHYKCIRGGLLKGLKEEFFTLTIGTSPSNLTIVEEDSQHIVYGYLNRVLDLHCTVIHGIPNGKLVWKVNNKILEEKRTALLVYSFKPKQEDHLQNYTCATKSDIAQYAMERTVQLFVYMPPIVSISLNKTLGILEGEDLTLYCNYSSNHELKELKWQKMFPHKRPLDERSPYLNIISINRQNAGKYKCTVANMVGIASDIVTIEVYYPPTVHVTFEDRENNRQLNCLANGVPDQYIYTLWEHRSEYSDLIRYLPDNGSGRLILPTTKGETDRHHDRGFYSCQASNNVSLNDSSSFVRGEYFLNAPGKPYFVTSNNNTQYGIKDQMGNLTIDFVSFPEIENISVIDGDMKHYKDYYTLESMSVMDKVYNKTVLVNGSRLVISMNIGNENDFRSYTIKLRNKFGLANFTIFLRSASCPETPEIMKIMPKTSKILIQWRAKFHGGFPQSVVIQYRRRDVQYWNEIPVSGPGMQIDSIDGLTSGTEYLIRIYSENIKGKSNFTDVKLIRTGSTKVSDNETLVFFVLVVPFLISIGVLYWQYKKGNVRALERISCFKRQQFIYEVGVGAVENNVYEMQNNVEQHAVAQNAVAQNLDVPVYSSIDRRANLTIGQTVSYSTTPKRKRNYLEKRKENRASVGQASGTVNSATKKGPDRLSYIEVSFEPNPNEYKFYIHGSENRTNYVDIDFSKKVSSYADSHRESDDDSIPQACAMQNYE